MSCHQTERVLKFDDNTRRTVFFHREVQQNTIYFFDRTYTLTGTRNGSTSPCGVRTRQVRIRRLKVYFFAQNKPTDGFTCFIMYSSIGLTFCSCTVHRVWPTKGNFVFIPKRVQPINVLSSRPQPLRVLIAYDQCLTFLYVRVSLWIHPFVCLRRGRRISCKA